MLPVEPFIAGTHTAATKSAFIRLANPPARALDGEKLQLLCHTHLRKPFINYSEDAKHGVCKGFTTEMWH
ncbi:protein of unknown function [Enterobacter cancerogenus]|nr:protein of unknown function [Enterobacter cancerogenus]